jgi:hypothetical protein
LLFPVLCRTLFEDGYDAAGNRVYDKVNGLTCHQCRQKTLGKRTCCAGCESLQVPACARACCPLCLWQPRAVLLPAACLRAWARPAYLAGLHQKQQQQLAALPLCCAAC